MVIFVRLIVSVLVLALCSIADAQVFNNSPNVSVVDPTTGTGAAVDSSGQMHVVMQGVIDANNSTTNLLGANGVFTGTATDISGYAGIGLFVTADQDSGTKGLKIQYSPDGAHWHDGEEYTYTANTEKFYTPPCWLRYYRVSYSNAATPQTDMHIDVMLHKSPIKWSSHNITDNLSDEDDAELVKAVIAGKNPAGTYVNFQSTTSGNFKISLEELENAISVNGNSQLRTTIYDEAGIPAEVDNSTHTLQVIDYGHHEIHAGSTFRVQAFKDAVPATGANGEVVIAFYVPTTTNKYPHMVWEFVHEGDMTMKLLEGITITTNTGGNVTCKNSNRSSSTTSMLQSVATGSVVSGVVCTNPVYSGGSIISLKRNFSTKNAPASSTRRNEVILNNETWYAFVLDNNETTTQGGQIRLEWYEHTNRD